MANGNDNVITPESLEKGLNSGDTKDTDGVITPETLKAGLSQRSKGRRAAPPTRTTGFGELNSYDTSLVPGSNRALSRASKQSTVGQLSKTAANLPLNIGLGLIETAGYLGELGHYGIAKIKDEKVKKDFSNALTEWAKGARNPLGDVYQENPNEVFDLTDPAWWMNNIGGLVESVGEFAVTGAGVGSVLGKGFGALARTLSSGKYAKMAAQGASYIGTASALGYTEGAMSGLPIFQEVYEAQMNEHGDHDRAMLKASESAATTVKNNTLLIGALSITSMSPMFRTTKALRRAKGAGLTRKTTESVDDYLARLKSAVDDPQLSRTFYQRYQVPIESLQESAEEISNLVAESRGRQVGGLEDADKSYFDLYMDAAFSEEGLLSAILGAAGGAGQIYAMSKLPMHRQQTPGEDGEVETRWMSADQIQETQQKLLVEGYAKRLKDDIEETRTLNKQLKEAINSGNEMKAREIKQKLFNVGMRRSIFLDGGETVNNLMEHVIGDIDNETDLGEAVDQKIEELQAQLEDTQNKEDAAAIEAQIEQLSLQREQVAGKTEAMLMGIAEEPGDNSAQQLIQEKKKQVKDYLDQYEDLLDQYNLADERAMELAEYVMTLQMQKDLLTDQVNENESRLNEIKSRIEKENRAIFGENHPSGLQELQTKTARRQSVAKVLNQAIQDANEVGVRGIKRDTKFANEIEGEAEATRSQKELMQKYKVDTLTELRKILKSRVRRSRRLYETLNKDVNDLQQSMEESDQSLPEMADSAGKIKFLDQRLQDGYDVVEQQRQDLADISERHNEITSATGSRDFVKRAYKHLSEQSEKRKKKKAKVESDETHRENKEEVEEIKKRKEAQEATEVPSDLPVADQIAQSTSLKQLKKIADENELTETQQELWDQKKELVESQSVTESEEDTVETEEATHTVPEDGEVENTGRTPAEMQEDYTKTNKDANEGYIEPDNLKVIDVNKLQYLSTDYVEMVVDGVTKKFTNATVPLDEFDKRLESDRYLQPGDTIRIYVDYDYSGNHYDEDGNLVENMTYKEILESDGEMNVPIRVEMIRGNEIIPIAYIPTLNWVTAKGAGGEFKNIAESVKHRENNAEYQTAYIKAIREKVLEAGQEGITTQIEDRSKGFWRINFATNEDGTVRRDPSSKKAVVESDWVSNLLPDKDIKFVVMRRGTLTAYKGGSKRNQNIVESIENRKAIEKEYGNGVVFAVLDGVAVPMYVAPLRETFAETLFQAIKAKHTDDTALIDAINETTISQEQNPFSFKGKDGLARFIRKYAHSRSFTPERLNSIKDSGKILFHVNDLGHVNIARVADGIIYTTDPKKLSGKDSQNYAPLVEDGQMTEAGEEVLRTYLTQLSFSVVMQDGNIPRLNNDAANFRATTISRDGQVNYDDVAYNEFIKRNMLTHINGTVSYNHGTEENPDLEYLYHTQPVIRFNTDFIDDNKLPASRSQRSTNSAEPGTLAEFLDEPEGTADVDRPLTPLEKVERDRWKEIRQVRNAGLDPNALDKKERDIHAKYDKKRQNVKSSEQEVEKKESDRDSGPRLSDLNDDLLGFPTDRIAENAEVDEDLKEELSRYNIGDFTPEQAATVIDNIIFAFSKQFERTTKTGDRIPFSQAREAVLDLFVNEYNYHQDEGDTYMAAQYGRVLSNWDQLEERAIDKLGIFGIGIQVDDSFESQESNYERSKYDSKAQWYEDRKNTASAQLKLFLATTPDMEFVKDGDGEVVLDNETRLPILKKKENFIGQPKFLPFDSVYDGLMEMFSDKVPDMETYMSELQDAGMTNPQYEVIRQKLMNLPEDSTIRKEFFVALSSQYLDMTLIFTGIRRQEGKLVGYNIDYGDTNRNSAIDRIYKGWVNNMKRSDLVVEEDGQLMIDKEKAQDLKKEYEKKLKNAGGPYAKGSRDAFRWLLDQIGVDLSDKAFNQVIYNSAAYPNSKFNPLLGPVHEALEVRNSQGNVREDNFVGILFNNLGSDMTDKPAERFTVGNPLTNGALRRAFRLIAATEFKYSPRVYSSSMSNVEGKTIYGHQMNTVMSLLFKEMDSESSYVKAVNGTNFGSKSWWYQVMQGDPNALSLEYADGIKSRDNSNRFSLADDMGPVDFDIFSMGLFHSTSAKTGGNSGRFLSLTKSDKDALPIIRAPRVNTVITLDDDGNVDSIKNQQLYNIAYAEMQRIYQHQDSHKDQLHLANQMPEGYSEGANYFYTFPFLNYESLQILAEDDSSIVTESMISRIYTMDYNEETDTAIPRLQNTPQAREAIKSIIEEQTIREIQEFKQELLDRGIIEADSNSNFIDFNYLQRIAKQYSKTDSKITYAIADFYVNKAIAHAEEMKYITGDPAFYYKSGENDLMAVKNTLNNMEKRGSRDVGPKTDMDWSKADVVRLVLDDQQFSAEDSGLPESYLREAAMEPTDAQEFTTLEEHLRTMVDWGKIPQSQMDKYMKIYNDPDRAFTTQQLEVILQPQKPLYAHNHVRKDLNLIVPLYVKSSSFPLIKEYTQGKPIDNLRKLMEEGNNAIDRVAFRTANKVGIINSLNIFDENGNIKEISQLRDELTTDHIDTIPREGLGIQQEVPYKESDQVTMVTQMNKLLFSGLRGVSGFTFRGEEYTGHELELIKEQVVKAMLERNKAKLFHTLGIEYSDGTIRIEDKSKVRDLLMREGKKRNWFLNDLESLQLTDDKTEFVLPLHMSGSAGKIEALMLSMISKVVTGNKVYGKAYVQGSPVGIRTVEDLTQKQQDSIVTTEAYDPNKGLQFIQKDGKDVTPAQIFIPWDFRDSRGNLLNINDFTKVVDGRKVIDHSKLPEDVLRTIGARIPNQGHNSMLPIQIAGFIPSHMGNLVIVPPHIVKQMGSDFDVDKLYTYLSQYHYDATTGELVRPEVYTENPSRLYEQFYSIATEHKDYLNQVIARSNNRELTMPLTSYIEQSNRINLDQYSQQDRIGLMMLIEDLAQYDGSYLPIDNIPSKDDFLEVADYDAQSLLPTRALQQQFMDIHWSVLMHPEAFQKITDPLDKRDLYQELADIQNRLGESSSIPGSPVFHRIQRDHRIDQKSGKDLIGVFALALTLSSTIEHEGRAVLKLQAYDPVNNRPVEDPIDVVLDGKKRQLTKISGEAMSSYNGKDRTKQDVISILLSAAVDNANEGLLGPLNINKVTASVAASLALMQTEDGKAVPIDFITGLLSQESIKMFVENYRSLQSSVQESYVSDLAETAVKRTAAELYSRLPENTKVGSHLFSASELKELLSDQEGDQDTDYVKRQIQALYLFKDINEKAQDISKLSRFLLGPTTAGTGTTVFDLMANYDGIESLMKNRFSIADVADLVGYDYDNSRFVDPNEIGAMLDNTIHLGRHIFSELTPYFDEVPQQVFDLHKEWSGKVDMTARDYRRIWSGLQSYINSAHIDKFGKATQKEYIMDLLFSKDNSLAHRILEAQSSWGRENFFIQRLEPEISEKPGVEPSIVSYRGAKGVRLDDSENLIALSALYTSKDPEVRELARDLTAYSMVLQGTQLPQGFYRYIPVPVMEHLDIAEELRGINYNRPENGTIDISVSPALTQIYQHRPWMARKIDMDAVDRIHEKGGSIVQFILPKPQDIVEEFPNMTMRAGFELFYPPFFSMEDTNNGVIRIYKHMKTNSMGEHLYEEVDRLGYKGNIREYEKQIVGTKESVFEDNRSNDPDTSFENDQKITKKAQEKQNQEPNGAVGDNIMSDYLSTAFHHMLGRVNNTEYNETLATILLSRMEKIPVKRKELVDKVAGYDATNGVIYFDTNVERDVTNKALAEEIILHEAIHAVTAQQIDAYLNDEMEDSNPAKKHIRALMVAYNKAKKATSDSSNFSNAFSDPHEFVAEALSNPEFQKYLNRIQMNSNQTVLERIKEVIANLVSAIANELGITVNKNSALEATLANVIAMTQEESTQGPGTQEDAYGGESRSERDLGDFLKGFPKSKTLSDEMLGLPEEIQSQVQSLESRISNVKSKISNTPKNTSKRKRLSDVLDRLIRQRKELVDKANVDIIEKVADEQLNWAEDIATKNTVSISELQTALDIVDSWDFDVTKNFFPDYVRFGKTFSRNRFAQTYKGISGRAGMVEEQLLNTIRKSIRDRVNGKLADLDLGSIGVLDLVKAEEVGALKSWFMDLSVMNNELATYIDEQLKEASRNAGYQKRKIVKKINELAEEIDDFEWIFEKDENGNYTGNFIDVYSSQYYMERREIYNDLFKSLQKAAIMDERNAAKLRSSAYSMFHRKSKQMEHTYDIRFEYIDGFKNGEGMTKKEYHAYMKEELGEQFDTIREKAKRNYQTYLSELDAFKQILETEMSELSDDELGRREDETDEEYKERRIHEWELEHSPIRYLNERFNDNTEINEYKSRHGIDFVVTAPRRTTIDPSGERVPTGYYNSEFQNMTEDQKKFHSYVMNVMEESLKYLPRYRTRNKDRTFVPRIRADLMETLQQDGLGAALKYAHDMGFESVTNGPAVLNDKDEQQFAALDDQGRPVQQIPIAFLSGMKKGDEENANPLEGFSKDVPKLISEFAGMALNYRYKLDIEDEVNLAYRLLKEASEKAMEAGKPVKDRFGNYMEFRDGLVNLTKNVEYAIDAIMYGKTKSEPKESRTRLFNTYNPIKHANLNSEARKIERERDKLQEQLDNNNITYDVYQGKMKKLEERYSELGTRNLVWTKVGEKVMYYTQLKGMGYNLTAGIANVGFGILSNFTWAASGADFTDTEMVKAMGIVTRAAFMKEKVSKVANLIANFNLLFEVAETEYGEQINKGATTNKTYRMVKESAFAIQRRTEFIVQGMSMVAKMLHTKVDVVTVDGEKKRISLYDAFDTNGEWDTTKYEPNDDWTLDVEPGETTKLTKFRNQTIQLNKYLHGNYDPNSRIRIKKYLLGRALIQFRSWVPFGFAQRFSREYTDIQLGRRFKGRYRTYSDIGLSKSMRGLFGQYFGDEVAFGKKGGADRLSELDIQNLKMNLREMHMLVAMMMIGVMMKSMLEDGDDDDPSMYAARILYNQLYRVEQDIYFYLSPATFEEITRNPLPVMKTYNDFSNAVTASLDYISNDDYQGAPVSEKWGKVVPLANQVLKTAYLAEHEIR